ncbi:unnamed protein product [Effrenium voratum]|uniref:Uncharacterized protein n=1 Tax=Effrenium voratum TaxID=2562239 RepID=A0AA36ICI8_9DINO|nr:unnamed protein product [Effrenium voratum]CAJ1413129.1 unnamed protein product [Effrenium voratum]CAJ1421939.1 unnamed protein product [Effrenium voratum]CAJ1429845.1 unnamed protein product [Effrenium voratum]CAJ1460370.1 unnamed protein product [Effrenium voratum]
MSSDLIRQLRALEKKLSAEASQIQELVRLKKNKNKHYAPHVAEVEKLMEVSKQRLELGKALIRASDKGGKLKSGDKPDGPSKPNGKS